MSAMPRKRIALVAAAWPLVVAGCGSNPPCEADLSAVDAARGAAHAAEAKLEELQGEKARLERRLREEEQRRTELERRKAQLAAEIAELEE